MAQQTLTVEAWADLLVPDLEAQAQGVRRYIGRRWDPIAHGFVPNGQQVIPARAEYVQACLEGSLCAVDKDSIAYLTERLPQR